MSTAITSRHVPSRGPSRGHVLGWIVLGWIATLVSGFRWGLEMRRRYDTERAAGRTVDEQAMRRLVSEVDAWQGRPS